MTFTRRAIGLLAGLTVIAWCCAPAFAADDASHDPPADHGAANHEASEHHEDEAGGPSGGHGNTNPVEVKGDLAIWTAVVFLIVITILWKFAWGPIAEGLDKREQRIADEISAAEKSNADARDLLQQYEDKLTASGDEIRQIIETGKRDAERIGDGIVEKARAEADADKRRALEEIDLAAAGALKELAERSATLAVDLAGKIVSEKLDKKAHAGLIAKAVSRFSRTTPSKN
jgi:F-type H+-transporting ATPase subunit b